MRRPGTVFLALILAVGVMGLATLAAQESAGDKTAGQAAEAGAKAASAAQSDTVGAVEPEVDSPVIAVPPNVRGLLDNHCVRCHGSGRPAKGHDLSSDDQVLAHIGAASAEMKNLALIDPGRPETSYLIMKVKGTDGIGGKRMPIGGSPLSTEEIAVLEDWVTSMVGPESETAPAEVDTTKPETTAPEGVTPDVPKPEAEQSKGATPDAAKPDAPGPSGK